MHVYPIEAQVNSTVTNGTHTILLATKYHVLL